MKILKITGAAALGLVALLVVLFAVLSFRYWATYVYRYIFWNISPSRTIPCFPPTRSITARPSSCTGAIPGTPGSWRRSGRAGSSPGGRYIRSGPRRIPCRDRHHGVYRCPGRRGCLREVLQRVRAGFDQYLVFGRQVRDLGPGGHRRRRGAHRERR